MPLSWNEIRANAATFARDWADASDERAEAQTFWNEFFLIFGVQRRTVGRYEQRVRRTTGASGFIDLHWPGVLIAEHKSRGRSLDAAESQAEGYIGSLHAEGRPDECPRYVVLSDFGRIRLRDLETGRDFEFPLAELPEHVREFGFIAGYRTVRFEPEVDIDQRAVELLGDLHDALAAGGYPPHDLERFLVRILFCLFAEDTGLFEGGSAVFQSYIETHTTDDGANLGAELSLIFQTLNTPENERQAGLREELAAMPYVNGGLFGEQLRFAAFNRDMRTRLVAATRFDWSRISPAIFGSLFQTVMGADERRQEGAHYTSERDILKVINPLFLDRLKDQLEAAGSSPARLNRLHDEIASLRLLDPACGCGNFLVIAYRELRRIETEILRRVHTGSDGRVQRVTDVGTFCRVDVSQLYGIELDEWPVRIAEVALWLVDHQMNRVLSDTFGTYFARLPLTTSPNIRHGNALGIDWNDVLPAERCSYVFGNPPFVGSKYQSAEQKQQMRTVCDGICGAGTLDYVAAWYVLADRYVGDRDTPFAFVSTNSITQGEQVGVLFGHLLRPVADGDGSPPVPHRRIRFAHRTFAWQSEARGAAHVHVVIIGLGRDAPAPRRLYDYEADPQRPTVTEAANISPYLTDGPDHVVVNRSRPICDVPDIGIGNKPIDEGNYLFTAEERDEFVQREPGAASLFREWYGAREFINREPRYCLWLGEVEPNVLRSMPAVLERIENVRAYRRASKSKPTQAIADTPTRFHVENRPEGEYLLIPSSSSIRRDYIPMGFMRPDQICSNAVLVFPDASLFDFGLLTSEMHMTWVRQVAGRLKSDYRYSKRLVYNNFPWPAIMRSRQQAAGSRQQAAGSRQQAAGSRQQAAGSSRGGCGRCARRSRGSSRRQLRRPVRPAHHAGRSA